MSTYPAGIREGDVMRRSLTRIVIEGRAEAGAMAIPFLPVNSPASACADVALLAATRATATIAMQGKTFCMSSPSD
jgi:hypothetical protein